MLDTTLVEKGCAHNSGSFTFVNFIQSKGLQPPSYLAPGKFYRFPGEGKKASNTAGYAKIFPDGNGGVCGDHSTGANYSWQAKREDEPFSPKLVEQRQKHLADKKRKETAQKAITEKAVASNAAEIAAKADWADPNFPYLTAKKLRPFDAKQGLHYHCRNKKCEPCLILKMIDWDFNVHNIQYIFADGFKPYMKSGAISGHFILASAGSRNKIFIAEGWATALAVSEQEPESTVIAATSSNNLHHVASATFRRFPDATIIIAGDDDRNNVRGNIGKKAALKAANACAGAVSLPKWLPGMPDHFTDFQDLREWELCHG